MQPLKMPSEPKEGEWKSETEAIWIPNHAYKMGGFWGASIDGSGGMVTAIGKTKEAAELLARKICDAVNSREKWLKDSSLSTHFPFTAERMNALEKENSELKEKVANLEETNTLLNRRVQAMESKHPERSHLWGSEETLKAEIVRLRKELANANRGAEMNYRVLQLSTKRVCKLHDELIAAQSDRDRFKKLAEELLEYAGHRPSCQFIDGGVLSFKPCDCGASKTIGKAQELLGRIFSPQATTTQP